VIDGRYIYVDQNMDLGPGIIFPGLPEVARRAIKEMHRQVGELKIDEQGLARRGVLVRHLVMPGGVVGTREIMKFLAREISPHTYINVMAQYFPAGKVSSEYLPEIHRRITQQEYSDAMALARERVVRFAETNCLGPGCA
jgi:putative pyruvate formate lyase activating enzyme